MKGLILAGGSGTRLRPLTHTGPKQLIPIANKPNILYCLEDLREAGIVEIGVILGNNMPEKVRDLLGDGSEFGVRISYIVQGEPRGIAHAVGCAEDFMGDDSFVVYLGDNILKGGIRYMVEEFAQGGYEALVALCPVENPEKFGIAELDDQGEIVSLVEKPKEPKSDLAMIGIYFLRKSIFPVIRSLKPSWRNELEITDAIDGLMRTGRVKARLVRGWWKDTGKPEDILMANHLVLETLERRNEGTLDEDVRLIGRVSIGRGTSVKRGSVIRGPVMIGENCLIGPDTYIGPYTSIGDGTTIINGEIESSIVIGGAYIDCGKKIVDSLIGAGCRITSSEDALPKGCRFIIGENSQLII
ncbi:MAG: glucose-1-phosphate thymidylyltransferase [Euryarchaeota archaeon]|nr:glucose-1-phosphate thymidylyltransferase [Euryarchaeota archaeon]